MATHPADRRMTMAEFLELAGDHEQAHGEQEAARRSLPRGTGP